MDIIEGLQIRFIQGLHCGKQNVFLNLKKKKHYVHLKCKVNVWQDFSQNEITKSQIN